MSEQVYYAYLLRLWRNRVGSPWRATLENPYAGERQAFATLADLVAFLERQTGEHIHLSAGDDAAGVDTLPET